MFKPDPGFFRRLKFYIFGFLIGALIVNVIFKGRACRMPSTLKMEELQFQTMQFSNKAKCQMLCMKMKESDVKKLLQEGEVNYNKSDVHQKPYALFAIENTNNDEPHYRVLISDRDSISEVIDIINLLSAKDSCLCK